MSSKWAVVGSSDLTNWLPENTTSDLKEKARVRWNRRKKAFNFGMKVKRMKTEKPKKNYKKDEESEE